VDAVFYFTIHYDCRVLVRDNGHEVSVPLILEFFSVFVHELFSWWESSLGINCFSYDPGESRELIIEGRSTHQYVRGFLSFLYLTAEC
jgi:hypothetical protein